jgi:hypothetical protein
VIYFQISELSGSEWLSKEKLSKLLIEAISDAQVGFVFHVEYPYIKSIFQYEQFLNVMSRLAEHPLSNKIKDFIMKFRYQLVNQAALAEIPKVRTFKDSMITTFLNSYSPIAYVRQRWQGVRHNQRWIKLACLLSNCFKQKFGCLTNQYAFLRISAKICIC